MSGLKCVLRRVTNGITYYDVGNKNQMFKFDIPFDFVFDLATLHSYTLHHGKEVILTEDL